MSCFSGLAGNPMVSGMATGGMSMIPGLFHHGGGGASNGIMDRLRLMQGQQAQPIAQPLQQGPPQNTDQALAQALMMGGQRMPGAMQR